MKKPSIILAQPQMGENIGGAVRAMFNFGLDDLRLISPRDGWPNERAHAMSTGALDKMPAVQVFDDTPAALSGFHRVYATTARPRDMIKDVMDAKEAAQDIVERAAQGQRTALLFGGERAGLSNDDIALSHVIITVPTNPDFSSMNLAQCVLLTSYEWFQAAHARSINETIASHSSLPAAHQNFVTLCERLEEELEAHHFFRAPEMKPNVVRNLRNMLARAEMTDQELRTFHGIISALTGKKIQS